MHCINLSLWFKFYYLKYSDVQCPNPFSNNYLCYCEKRVTSEGDNKKKHILFSFHTCQVLTLCAQSPRAAFRSPWEDNQEGEKGEGTGHRAVISVGIVGAVMFQNQGSLLQPPVKWYRKGIPSNAEDINDWCGINTFFCFLGVFQYLWANVFSTCFLHAVNSVGSWNVLQLCEIIQLDMN